ncbi:S8 family serine peptidase [Ornithinibacillus xuwenensis]|uniref:S8 family serine peptidase n=1 Tax=Ornithinibacillus xuwenensis TaxID=3144668 RepID=A0ABU9XKW0_9BACI
MRRKRRNQVRAFSLFGIVLMVLSLITPVMATAESLSGTSVSLNGSSKASVSATKVSERLVSDFKDNEKVTFIVKFKEKADVEKAASKAKANAKKASLSAFNAEIAQRSAVISELKATATESQKNVMKFLEQEVSKGNAENVRPYHIVNGIAVTATKEVAEKIANFPEVEKILKDETRHLFEVTVDEKAQPTEAEIANVEWNVERVGAPQVWNMGIDGSGIVVASLDSGVQWDHPALQEKYRGYNAATGEVDHTYSFFDAIDGVTEPYDDHGHGTHVTGTMVGSEPDGSNQIGVAPGAKFISARIFDASGSGTDAPILAAGEWMLAPGGDVSMAPDVINNSWGGGSGLDEWYRDVVIAWRAAGIFPEFSAGNTDLFNPGGPGSIAVPANYPESFATGATDINNNLASFSLEGPSPYGEIKPEISAPGVNIRSSVPGGAYEGGWNGTSMAGPAVSAVVALLLQANSSLSVDDIEQILTDTAIPLTNSEYPESPNNGFGHGLVNAYDAVSSVMNGLGTIEGQVTMDGEDTEDPVLEHSGPSETFAGMDLDLSANVSDNVGIVSVELSYQNNDGEWQTVEATQSSGDHASGEFVATIPGEEIEVGTLNYKFTVTDFGNNPVESDVFSIAVNAGITTGYFQDFETTPAGWSAFGNGEWEWGEPVSGPGEAYSGAKVYGTDLDDTYESGADSTLMLPPVDLPEGSAYLQFQQWHNLEMYDSGTAYDFGYVVISTDGENWTELVEYSGDTDGWESAEVDLSEYSGQRVYLGFKYTSDGSVVREGWYIDDVALSETSLGLAKDKGSEITQENNLKADESAKKVELNKAADSVAKEEDTVVEKATPMSLPLAAQVSVLESGRSVMTNPADGSYSMTHPAGEFTVVAETYGFRSEQQTISLDPDATVTANFNLEELPKATVSGTITSQKSGNPIEGATVLLVEDANVQPVMTDENGNYSITAYEGTYTLKVIARDYHGQELEVTFDSDKELNIELEPYFTYPGGEIGYDDGTAENARAFYDAGNGWAVKMSLPEGQESALVTDGVFQFHGTDWPTPGGTNFAVEVWDASGEDGLPGEKLAGPIDAEAIRSLDEWTVVDLREHNIQVNGDFYMVYIQTDPNPNTPGLATDESSANAGRSYQLVGGAWSEAPADEGNYMIRARIAYEVEAPVITSPADNLYTNEANVTVEGNASPTTTVTLSNNGEEVGSVEVGEDGTFSFDTELTEGENVFTAASIVNGEEAGVSEAVTVNLDTNAPELTIDNPADGDETNRETVTVEGTVDDENLDFVKVNGQAATVDEDGNYSKRILLDEGENTIEVVAQDLAGNTSTESVTITADYTLPEITNLTPTEDHYLEAGESVKIEFDSEADLRATYVIHMPLTNLGGAMATFSNPTELPMMETSDGHYVGYWTATSNVMAEGAVIEVIVKDDFGNEARQQAEGKLFINTGEGDNGSNSQVQGKLKGNWKN